MDKIPLLLCGSPTSQYFLKHVLPLSPAFLYFVICIFFLVLPYFLGLTSGSFPLANKNALISPIKKSIPFECYVLFLKNKKEAHTPLPYTLLQLLRRVIYTLCPHLLTSHFLNPLQSGFPIPTTPMKVLFSLSSKESLDSFYFFGLSFLGSFAGSFFYCFSFPSFIYSPLK